jgi:hypothetical protein
MLEMRPDATPRPRAKRRPKAAPAEPLTLGEAAFVDMMLTWYERAGRPRDGEAEDRVQRAVEALRAISEP